MFAKAATILLIGVIFQAIYICTSVQGPKKVTVALYYESLCPYCHNFIDNQLVPTFNIMSDFIKVELVPYGNGKRNYSDGYWHFTCQHGKPECEENLVDACAVQLLQDDDASMLLKFVYCMNEHKDTPLNNKTDLCTKDANIPLQKIKSCVESPKAEQLMLSMAKKTESVRPTLYEVPTIQINGVHEPKEQKEIVSNFKKFICKHLHDPQPEICYKV